VVLQDERNVLHLALPWEPVAVARVELAVGVYDQHEHQLDGEHVELVVLVQEPRTPLALQL